MKILKSLLITVGVIVFLFALFIIHSTMSDYRPKEITRFHTVTDADTINLSSPFSILIWNIGYAGLDKDMDFFYDGGEKVRTPEPRLMENMNAITAFVRNNDTADFIFLQEIDRKSHRSYGINELKELRSSLHGFDCFFGKNYDVSFVPVPVTNPMGSVLSGIVTFSCYHPSDVSRYSFPGNYAWPKSLFMLDRCFLVSRYPVSGGSELVLINTHNSAYDDGSLRKMQMAYLKKFILNEYASGNYVLVGGDWNQCPPFFSPRFNEQPFDSLNLSYIPEDYLPEGWTWAYDRSVPSNRRVVMEYTRGKTLTTVIDFFLLSPNLRLASIKAIDLGFENSDHNPVVASFTLFQP